MVAFLTLVILALLAWLGSTWATIERKNERIAELEAVLERRGESRHEVPRKPPDVPVIWGDDDAHTKTIECVAPARDDDKTDPCVLVL